MSPATLDLAAHTRQIRHLARRWRSHLHGPTSVEDLEQVGWEALLSCQARHQPAQGSLHTYADRRIAGAMQDELIRLDQRSRRAKRQGVPPYTFVPLENSLLPATPVLTPDPWLAALVARLPARLQLVLRLSVVEDWTLEEIAAKLGCSSSRVWQVRTQALAALRQRLEEPA